MAQSAPAVSAEQSHRVSPPPFQPEAQAADDYPIRRGDPQRTPTAPTSAQLSREMLPLPDLPTPLLTNGEDNRSSSAAGPAQDSTKSSFHARTVAIRSNIGSPLVARSSHAATAKPLKMPFVAQLPPDYREELQREQDNLRKKAAAAEQKRIRAREKERYRQQAEIELKQQLERAEKEEQLRQQAAARQQQYAKALSDARADPDKQKIWHCSITGEQYGPMQESVVRVWVNDGRIGEDDYVRVEGADTWIRLSDISERFNVPVEASTVQAGHNAPQSNTTARNVCKRCHKMLPETAGRALIAENIQWTFPTSVEAL